jgi:GTP-binding protein Era
MAGRVTRAEAPTRCGFVALIGAPNAGKSTLLNRLVGAKISIVTPKVQTTRARVRGIAMAGASQIIFVDTPGIFAPRRRLDRAMVQAAWRGVADADIVALLVDAARGLDADVMRILEGLGQTGRPAILALNKIDRVGRDALLPVTGQLDAAGRFDDVFMISALTGDGVDTLRSHLAANLPEGPWLYPEDQLSDMPERLFAAEVTREQLFLQLRQELPYALTVETEQWRDRPDGSARIDQLIYVRREGHKGILLGKGGQRIKAVGQAARSELERMLDRRVHLFLRVKVRENWVDDPARYRDWNLDFNA